MNPPPTSDMIARPIPVTTVDSAEAIAKIMELFARPFPAEDVKLKPQMVKNNRALAIAYVSARAAMDLLDRVVHGDGWQDEYVLLPNGSVECRLSVWLGGKWITKADVGSQSEQPDEGDRMKSAYSDAFKRAAVKFGIGRYLYRMKSEWMDYDPVKKCIIVPQQGGTTSRQSPVQTVQPTLAQRCKEAILAVKSRPELAAIYEDYHADRKDGKFTPKEIEEIDAAVATMNAKYPKPVKV